MILRHLWAGARGLRLMTTAASSSFKRAIIVGDIHGCLDEFNELLKACNYHAPNDQLVLVGDLVAKGPDSVGVVKRARELGANCVLGNHDYEIFDIKRKLAAGEPEDVQRPEHLKILRELPPDDVLWLEQLPLFLRIPQFNTVVVHAGFLPGVPLEEQNLQDVIKMRNVVQVEGKPQGREVGEEGVPWITTWEGPETVVFGHDASRGLQETPFSFGLDTGACYGGYLTALILPERQLVAVRSRRVYTAPKGVPDYSRLTSHPGIKIVELPPA